MGHQTDKDYIELLRTSPYDPPGRESLAFGYQCPDESADLRRLREGYDLDAVGGRGAEVDRLLRLMAWVHGRLKYDGEFGCLPDERNSLHILGHPLAQQKGVNCRMLAIVLNEVFLAVGCKSRIVTCMPHDAADSDCHVLTSVYAENLRRWVLLDPTFNAHFTDDRGQLLGPQEVRGALSAGSPLLVGPGIDVRPGPTAPTWWGTGDLPAFYGSYMAKILFRMQVPFLSEFNYESSAKDTFYCELQPTNYGFEGPRVTRRRNGYRSVNLVTSDPSAFWAPPQ